MVNPLAHVILGATASYTTGNNIALLALSAGIGATVGGDTASTANNAGQTQYVDTIPPSLSSQTIN